MALALALLAAISVSAWAALHRDEPTYDGKRLREWLTAGYDGSASRRGEANEAVRRIGTNGLPFYRDWLGKEDRPWRLRTLEWIDNNLAWVRFDTRRLRADRRRLLVYEALRALGPEGRAALPELAQAIETRSPVEKYAAAMTLATMRQDGVGVLTNALGSSDARVRIVGVRGLGEYGGSVFWRSRQRTPEATQEAEFAKTIVVPLLVACLKDSNPDVKEAALDSLRAFPYDASTRTAIVSVLSDDLRSTAGDDRVRATVVLGTVTPGPGDGIPSLAELLHDPDKAVRLAAAQALANYGENARAAIPALQKACDDEDHDVRNAAYNALARIDPKAPGPTPAK
jgi:HEAT repeat protein